MVDLTLRHRIFSHLADTGTAPDIEAIAGWLGDTSADQHRARLALRDLHNAHMLVLDDDGRADAIRMALPFSAIATDHVVASAPRSWWANCAWDALAIPAMLNLDARIDARWIDTDEPVELGVEGGALTHHQGNLHFVVPARHWWDDIVET